MSRALSEEARKASQAKKAASKLAELRVYVRKPQFVYHFDKPYLPLRTLISEAKLYLKEGKVGWP